MCLLASIVYFIDNITVCSASLKYKSIQQPTGQNEAWTKGSQAEPAGHFKSGLYTNSSLKVPVPYYHHLYTLPIKGGALP